MPELWVSRAGALVERRRLGGVVAAPLALTLLGGPSLRYGQLGHLSSSFRG